MSSSLATSTFAPKPRDRELRRVAFVGEPARLSLSLPDQVPGLTTVRLDIGARRSEALIAALEGSEVDAVVVLDPATLPAQTLEHLGALPALTLGLLMSGSPPEDIGEAVGRLDRLASFNPALTGMPIGASTIWRAIPPPISDVLFGEVQRMRRRPRAISIGRSTEHREAMLLPSKHHHDLLQVLHGVSGGDLAQLLREYDVGVYIAPSSGAGFGAQAAIHLAAGQILLSEWLSPAHGLERGIDYLEISSADDLEWKLSRLARFPEMYHSIRVRGRMKAEQFRASRVFSRIVYDLFADVAAFGRSTPRSARKLQGMSRGPAK